MDILPLPEATHVKYRSPCIWIIFPQACVFHLLSTTLDDTAWLCFPHVLTCLFRIVSILYHNLCISMSISMQHPQHPLQDRLWHYNHWYLPGPPSQLQSPSSEKNQIILSHAQREVPHFIPFQLEQTLATDTITEAWAFTRSHCLKEALLLFRVPQPPINGGWCDCLVCMWVTLGSLGHLWSLFSNPVQITAQAGHRLFRVLPDAHEWMSCTLDINNTNVILIMLKNVKAWLKCILPADVFQTPT